MTHQKFTPQEISYSFRNIKNENGYQVIVKQKLKMSISENKKAKMELKTLCKFQNIVFANLKKHIISDMSKMSAKTKHAQGRTAWQDIQGYANVF